MRILPILDSGAERSVIDGTVALALGWDEAQIAASPVARPIAGIGSGTGHLVGYEHRVVCAMSFGPTYAEIELLVFFTPPNTVTTPVLGRRDFFEQVDFAMLQAERTCLLRFRDRSALRPRFVAD